MASLFSEVNSNKLRRDVQNEVTLICAKFDKDLFNISKVIGRFWPTRYNSPMNGILNCNLMMTDS